MKEQRIEPDLLSALLKCKRIVNEFSPSGFGFMRSDLYARGIIRDLLLFRSYVPTGSSVLDIGCGLGYITSVLSPFGYSCIGIDLPPCSLTPDFQKEEHRHDCWRTFQRQYCVSYAYYDGKSIPLQNESMDAVIIHGVLEHVQGGIMQAFLADIRRVLKEKGYFFVFRCPRKLALTEGMASALGIPHHEILMSEEYVVRELERHFLIELIDQTDTLPQHFPSPIQNICNILTPALYQVQCMLDHSVFNRLSHHLRIVAVRKQ